MKIMKTQLSTATMENLNLGTPGVNPDLYLEIESQGGDQSLRLPVSVKDLSAEGLILEAIDLPPKLQGESLLHQEGIIHMVPDGFTKETLLRSKVVWMRQGERGPSHYLLGLELGEADFRARRSLEKLIARPKDISDLWTYWDQVQPIPASHNGRIIFYVGAAALLGGVALQVALPDFYNAPATILIFFGIYTIAGKCLWNWWRKRSIPKEC
jgi:hypothetical protein